MYEIFLSKKAYKDRKLLKQAGLELKTKKLLNILSKDPFQVPPRYESLRGELEGYYSRRINIQHRLVYSVDIKKKIVYVYRMWTVMNYN
jgi:Txe/YoeB family toxin of toxin-antitoxin system